MNTSGIRKLSKSEQDKMKFGCLSRSPYLCEDVNCPEGGRCAFVIKSGSIIISGTIQNGQCVSC
ncbi:hypothetical protein KORDIASMS9_01685 [Kordia sp. SMS9]|nr:hypothetical protein KORDIASMS9_01685 [Kordia sp. SMS9]